MRSITWRLSPARICELEWQGRLPGLESAQGARLLTVWLKEFTGDEIKIEITKASGQPVANLKAPGAPGFTRLNWDLRPTKDVSIEHGGDNPKRLLPAGDYTAELSFWIAKNENKNFHVDLAEGITPR